MWNDSSPRKKFWSCTSTLFISGMAITDSKKHRVVIFGKEPQDLTDSEAVLLAGIPNAPSAYAPSRHADLALQREKQVLAAMVKYGYLEQSETDSLLWDAAADPVLAR